MANVTYYVALPFMRTEEGELVPGEAQDRHTAFAAVNAARKLARMYPGAVAFSRTGDPESGDFADATILRMFGEVGASVEMADA